MTFLRFTADSVASAAAAGALACLLAAPAVSAGEKPDEKPDETHGAMVRIVADADDGTHAIGEYTLEVAVEDGAVSVRLNGEEVPEDRIVREGDAIVILDDLGNEIETVDVSPFGDTSHVMKLRVGGDDGRLWISGDEATAEPPNVMIGIRLDAPGPALAHHLRIKPDEVTMITALYEGLPAHDAGLEPYDLITAIDGRTPADPRTLRSVLAGREPGDVLRLSVIQRGRKKEVEVELASFDRGPLEEAAVIGEGDRDRTIIFSPDVLRGRLRLPRGFGNTFELEELDGMDGLFLDDRNRLFEWRHDSGSGFGTKPGSGFGSSGADRGGEPRGGVDARLKQLDRRLEGLERLLDELLEQAERDDER